MNQSDFRHMLELTEDGKRARVRTTLVITGSRLLDVEDLKRSEIDLIPVIKEENALMILRRLYGNLYERWRHLHPALLRSTDISVNMEVLRDLNDFNTEIGKLLEVDHGK